MEFTAKKLASFLNGEIVGNPDAVVNKVSKIEEGSEGSLSFLANPQYTKYIYTTSASIVIVNRDFAPEKDISSTLIKVDDAYSSFAGLLEFYDKQKHLKTGIEDMAFVHDKARLGKDVFVAAFSYISENAVIGDNVKIYPQVFIGENVEIQPDTIIHSGVKIYRDCKIGANCIVHSGTVVGSDGFGFAPSKKTNYTKIPQVGNVIIEDNVEIGSNCSIDRATMGSTIIRNGAKLDNLIQIAHNVEIGENSVVIAQSGIAGSTKIGKECIIAAQAGVIGHLTIGDGVRIGAQSGVTKNIKNCDAVLGSPAMNYKEYNKSYVHFKKLPELIEEVSQLKKELAELKKKE